MRGWFPSMILIFNLFGGDAMTELVPKFYCVKEGECHREYLCIGVRDDGFVCPYLRVRCYTKYLQLKS